MTLSEFAVVGRRYRHFKGGVYEVTHLERDRVGSAFVHYASADGRVWAQPLWRWAGMVDTPEGRRPRFAPAETEP
jgi:hypothetical protein